MEIIDIDDESEWLGKCSVSDTADHLLQHCTAPAEAYSPDVIPEASPGMIPVEAEAAKLSLGLEEGNGALPLGEDNDMRESSEGGVNAMVEPGMHLGVEEQADAKVELDSQSRAEGSFFGVQELPTETWQYAETQLEEDQEGGHPAGAEAQQADLELVWTGMGGKYKPPLFKRIGL